MVCVRVCVCVRILEIWTKGGNSGDTRLVGEEEIGDSHTDGGGK